MHNQGIIIQMSVSGSRVSEFGVGGAGFMVHDYKSEFGDLRRMDESNGEPTSPILEESRICLRVLLFSRFSRFLTWSHFGAYVHVLVCVYVCHIPGTQRAIQALRDPRAETKVAGLERGVRPIGDWSTNTIFSIFSKLLMA